MDFPCRASVLSEQGPQSSGCADDVDALGNCTGCAYVSVHAAPGAGSARHQNILSTTRLPAKWRQCTGRGWVYLLHLGFILNACLNPLPVKAALETTAEAWGGAHAFPHGMMLASEGGRLDGYSRTMVARIGSVWPTGGSGPCIGAEEGRALARANIREAARLLAGAGDGGLSPANTWLGLCRMRLELEVAARALLPSLETGVDDGNDSLVQTKRCAELVVLVEFWEAARDSAAAADVRLGRAERELDCRLQTGAGTRRASTASAFGWSAKRRTVRVTRKREHTCSAEERYRVQMEPVQRVRRSVLDDWQLSVRGPVGAVEEPAESADPSVRESGGECTRAVAGQGAAARGRRIVTDSAGTVAGPATVPQRSHQRRRRHGCRHDAAGGGGRP